METETNWEIRRDKENRIGVKKTTNATAVGFEICREEEGHHSFFLDLTREDLVNLRTCINAALA